MRFQEATWFVLKDLNAQEPSAQVEPFRKWKVLESARKEWGTASLNINSLSAPLGRLLLVGKIARLLDGSSLFLTDDGLLASLTPSSLT